MNNARISERWLLWLSLLAAPALPVATPAAAQAPGTPPPAAAEQPSQPELDRTPDTATDTVDDAEATEPIPDIPESPIALDTEDLDRIQVDADRFETYEESGARIVTASGRVRATVTGSEGEDAPRTMAVITADVMTANMEARTLSARGNVTILSEMGAASGEALEYRWAEGAGRAENVTFRQYGITFRAGALEIARARQAAYDVEFSTCGLDNPDFLVSADRIEIVPEKRIEARGVVVELFRRRVVRLPRLLYRLGAGRAQARQALPVARPGYSQASGFSVAQPIPMGRDFDAEVEPTTRAGLRGRLLYQPEGIPSLYADLAWKQEEGVRDRRPVLVSRMPEVGLRLGRGRRRNLAAGYYREHDTGARSGRLHLEHEVSVLSLIHICWGVCIGPSPRARPGGLPHQGRAILR